MSGRSGPTQPEGERSTLRVQLRLQPDVAEALRRLARAEKLTLAEIISRWVREHRAAAR